MIDEKEIKDAMRVILDFGIANKKTDSKYKEIESDFRSSKTQFEMDRKLHGYVKSKMFD
jgi:hypothetical protein